MKNTGKVYKTMLGTVDFRTGAFRKGNVNASVSYFANFDKVERLTKGLIKKLNEGINSTLSISEQLNLFLMPISVLSVYIPIMMVMAGHPDC
jgi:hypothetical protein